MILNHDYKSFNFPVGELHLTCRAASIEPVFDVEWEFEKNEDILELLFFCDAQRRLGRDLRFLKIAYVPFSRQDRVNNSKNVANIGECFSLAVFADLINSLGAKEVVVCDPHSDVTPALIENCRVISQDEIFFPQILNLEKRFKDGEFMFNDFFLISPDAGATKKIYKLAARISGEQGNVSGFRGFIECTKNRNVATGEITDTAVHCGNILYSDCLIVDDICDGGRTFIEIAKVLKTKNAGKIVLMVTHGFFTKGLGVFDGLIDEIYTRKGRVK